MLMLVVAIGLVMFTFGLGVFLVWLLCMDALETRRILMK
jgi:hypothetical protein